MPPTQRRSTSIGPTGRPPDDDAGGGAVVGDGVEDLALVLEAGVDDLERRHHVFGRAQHVGQPDAGPLEPLAEHEGELDLDAGQAEILVRHLGAVGDHHVVEQVAVIRLVDLGGALHRLRGEPDLVADQLGARRDLAVRDEGRDRVGILDDDVGEGLGELDRLFALLFGLHQDIGGLIAFSFRKHGVLPSAGMGVAFGAPLILERPANDNEPRLAFGIRALVTPYEPHPEEPCVARRLEGWPRTSRPVAILRDAGCAGSSG